MDPEEIARRELERLEKKKRKQERRLLKSQNKLQAGDLFHTPGSDSDSGVSHATDSGDTVPGPPYDSVAGGLHLHGGEAGCEHGNPPHNQRHAEQEAAAPELDSPGHRAALCASRASGGAQKLNPFSVESLLSDSRPRRNPAALAPSRPLIGKGHFLLYPITQPLGFIVPQTALKTTASPSSPPSSSSSSSSAVAAASAAAAVSCDSDGPGGEMQQTAGRRNSSSSTSSSSLQDSTEAAPEEQRHQQQRSPHSSPSSSAFLCAGQSTQISVICSDSDRREQLEGREQQRQPASPAADTKTDAKEDVDME